MHTWACVPAATPLTKATAWPWPWHAPPCTSLARVLATANPGMHTHQLHAKDAHQPVCGQLHVLRECTSYNTMHVWHAWAGRHCSVAAGPTACARRRFAPAPGPACGAPRLDFLQRDSLDRGGDVTAAVVGGAAQLHCVLGQLQGARWAPVCGARTCAHRWRNRLLGCADGLRLRLQLESEPTLRLK